MDAVVVVEVLTEVPHFPPVSDAGRPAARGVTARECRQGQAEVFGGLGACEAVVHQ